MSVWLGDYDRYFRAPEIISPETERKKRNIIRNHRWNTYQKLYHLAELCMQSCETLYIPAKAGAIRISLYNNDGGLEVHIVNGYLEDAKTFRVAEFEDDSPYYLNDNVDDYIWSPTNRPVYRFMVNNTFRASRDTAVVYVGLHANHPISTKVKLGLSLEQFLSKLRTYKPLMILPYHTDLPYNALVANNSLDSLNLSKPGNYLHVTRQFVGGGLWTPEYYPTERHKKFLQLCTDLSNTRDCDVANEWKDYVNRRIYMSDLAYHAEYDKDKNGNVTKTFGIPSTAFESCLPEELEQLAYQLKIDWNVEKYLACWHDYFMLASEDKQIEYLIHDISVIRQYNQSIIAKYGDDLDFQKRRDYKTNLYHGTYGFLFAVNQDHIQEALQQVKFAYFDDMRYYHYFRHDQKDFAKLYDSLPDERKRKYLNDLAVYNKMDSARKVDMSRMQPYKVQLLEKQQYAMVHGKPYNLPNPDDLEEHFQEMAKEWTPEMSKKVAKADIKEKKRVKWARTKIDLKGDFGVLLGLVQMA
jgi:hypothetical protein